MWSPWTSPCHLPLGAAFEWPGRGCCWLSLWLLSLPHRVSGALQLPQLPWEEAFMSPKKKTLPASAAACVCPRANCLGENVSSSVLMKRRTIVRVSKTAKLFCCFSWAHQSWCSGTSVNVSPAGVMFPSMAGSGFILLHSEKLQASTSSLKTLLF